MYVPSRYSARTLCIRVHKQQGTKCVFGEKKNLARKVFFFEKNRIPLLPLLKKDKTEHKRVEGGREEMEKKKFSVSTFWFYTVEEKI